MKIKALAQALGLIGSASSILTSNSSSLSFSFCEMAQSNTMLRPWFLDLVPLLVVLLIAAHVFTLVTLFKSCYLPHFEVLMLLVETDRLILFDVISISSGVLDLQISYGETAAAATAKKSALRCRENGGL